MMALFSAGLPCSRGGLAGLLLICVAAAGCGQAEFERRLDKNIAVLKQAGKFKELNREPQPIFTTPFGVRLPMAFPRNGFFTTDSPNPSGQPGNVTQKELQPPFVTLPGIQFLIQNGALGEGNANLPYFGYFAGEMIGAFRPNQQAQEGNQQPAPEGNQQPAENKPAETKPEPLTEEELSPTGVLAQLAKAFPKQTNLQWEGVDCQTPVLGAPPIHWQRIHIEAPQMFDYMGNLPTGQAIDGTFELWLYEGDGYRIYIGWRAPNQVLNKVPMFGPESWAELVAGTLQRVQNQ